MSKDEIILTICPRDTLGDQLETPLVREEMKRVSIMEDRPRANYIIWPDDLASEESFIIPERWIVHGFLAGYSWSQTNHGPDCSWPWAVTECYPDFGVIPIGTIVDRSGSHPVHVPPSLNVASLKAVLCEPQPWIGYCKSDLMNELVSHFTLSAVLFIWCCWSYTNQENKTQIPEKIECRHDRRSHPECGSMERVWG